MTVPPFAAVSELSLLTRLFDNLPMGIIVLDAEANVLIFNRAEELLAGRRREGVLGRQFFTEVAPCMNVKQLAGEFAKIGAAPIDVDLEFSFPFPLMDAPRDVRVKLRSFEVGGQPHGFLMVEDISFARSVERMRETLQNLLVHDLKNPLTAVLSSFQFLSRVDGLRDNQDALEATSDGVDAARRLQRMLGNLLDITRLETNTFPLRREPLQLEMLLAQVQDDNRAAAKGRGTELVVELPTEALEVSLDGSVLRRALDNLAENAVRQSRRVVLSARAVGGALWLEVRDDGPGIPEAVRARIFEKYAQVETPGSGAETYNRGLGLTFVRLAARAHGGDVTVECPTSGGTCFRIAIPPLVMKPLVP